MTSAAIGAAPVVAVTGAGGLIGSALTTAWRAAGVGVVRLVRRPPRTPDELEWHPGRGIPDPTRLAGADAVVHLAGAGIADRPWSAARKRLLRASRVDATRALCASLASLDRPPATLIMASAIGYYGDRGDERLTEASPPGTGFLAGLAQEWEGAAAAARARGIRVVALRNGLVLSGRGGLLARLLLPYRLGLGGVVGDPDAWWSWIAIDDVVGLVEHARTTPSLDGPVNATAPAPATNHEFAHTLARVLRRPAWMRVPSFALRLALGELADEAVLASVRAEPARALESGYRFRWTELAAALRHVLEVRSGRPSREP